MNKKVEDCKRPPKPTREEEALEEARDGDSGEYVTWDEEETWPGGEHEE